jgi:hypothetical protein
MISEAVTEDQIVKRITKILDLNLKARSRAQALIAYARHRGKVFDDTQATAIDRYIEDTRRIHDDLLSICKKVILYDKPGE